MLRSALRLLLAVALLAGATRSARAQTMDHAYGESRRLSGGGEITGVLGPRDDIAFFNYTDYDHNALRVGRIRLFGEWRPVTDRLSVIAEIRSENATSIEAPALYLRWHPVRAHNFFVQAGRIPPVIGAFPRRAYGRDNAVLGLPLAYQYLTSLRPDALPLTTDDLLRMRARGWRPNFPLGSQAIAPGISLLSISRFDTGVEGAWSNDRLDVAAAVTLGSPAVPVVRDRNSGLMASGRIGAHLPAGVTVGVSGGRGTWLNNSVLGLTVRGTSTPAAQSIAGADFELGLGRWLVRSEWIRSSFEIPIATEANPNVRLIAWSAFVEARYQLQPRWQVGARVDDLAFSNITGTTNGGAPTSWDAPVKRAEATIAFRASRHFELRGGWQQNWRTAGRVHTRGFPALAGLYWF